MYTRKLLKVYSIVLVVLEVDNTIHQINNYLVDSLMYGLTKQTMLSTGW